MNKFLRKEAREKKLAAKLSSDSVFCPRSPLTPALSPLRGEGVASNARRGPHGRRRVQAFGANVAAAKNAARGIVFTEGVCRAPSPLNGERAGVRGEHARRPHVRAIASAFFRFFSALLLCALLGGGLRVFAFPGAPALELLPAAAVDSAGIFLHQIATANQSVLPPQPIRLADAPAFGQAASLSRAQIVELLKSAAPGIAATNWSGAAQVRVTRRTRPLNERELRDLLTATLQKDFVKDKGDLELRLTRPWASVFVPDETLVLKIIDLPATGVGAHFIARFELFAGQDRLGPWQVVAQGKVMKDILVAGTTVRRGQGLQDANFTVEWARLQTPRRTCLRSRKRNASVRRVSRLSARCSPR